MTVEYLDLTDDVAIAAEIIGLDLLTLMHVTRMSGADSALHAPAAGFGDVDMYPDFVDKAAVLLVRLNKNHPLPDGNKRAAWVSKRLFVAVMAAHRRHPWHVGPSCSTALRRAHRSGLIEDTRHRGSPGFRSRLWRVRM